MRQPGAGGRRSAGLLGLYALVLVGVLATMFAVREERTAVQEYDTRAAEDAATRLRAAFAETVGSLRGVDAVAVSGRFDPAAYLVFARQVVDDSLYPALAFAQIVAPDEREVVEQANGLTIQDTDGAGGFRTAALRDPAFVVVDVYPRTKTTDRVLGFDIASDPVRRAAANAALFSETPVLSDRISTVTGARTGLSVVQAVHTPTGEAIGVVTSGLTVQDLISRSGIDVRSLAGFELRMDGEDLTGAPTGGATQSFDVAGRRFQVSVDEGHGMDLRLPLLIGLGTCCLAVGVGWAAVRDHRQRTRLARLSRRNRGVAELGQLLAGSLDSSTVLAQVARHAEPILDAQWSLVVRRTPEIPQGEPVPSEESPDEPGTTDRSLPDPVRASIDAASQVAAAHPEVVGRPLEVVSRAGTLRVVELISTPLMFTNGICVGAVAFGWTKPLTPEQAEDRSFAATTVAELASRAMERAVITEVVQHRTRRLSILARTLASAHTSEDVRRAVDLLLAPLVDARSAELVGVDAGGSKDPAGTADRPVRDAEGRTVVLVRVEWASPRAPTQTEDAVLDTVSDLIGQTLARTALADQEHEVIVQLQRDLLPDVPSVDGLDIAFRYAPAMTVVGLGGDFYDVIAATEGRTFVVIGDITGHGSEAVAAMAELKSVVHHLLESDHPMESVMDQADLVLDRRVYLATAQIVEIDTERDTVRYLNAGHPYPVLRPHGRQGRLLIDGHRPMLGLGTATDIRAAEEAFEIGDLLLLYTDGLIERRDRAIDQTMDDLVTVVGEVTQDSADDIVDQIQVRGSAAARRVDDDIALIAVKRVDEALCSRFDNGVQARRPIIDRGPTVLVGSPGG